MTLVLIIGGRCAGVATGKSVSLPTDRWILWHGPRPELGQPLPASAPVTPPAPGRPSTRPGTQRRS
jgi:hypothetical protein